MGFGSDGASVMIGRVSGVSTLALATAQSSDEISYLKKFKTIIHSLFQFYHNSPVRTAGRHATQIVLGDQTLEAIDVRWISHNNAVQSLCRTLPSVVASLEREAVKEENPWQWAW